MLEWIKTIGIAGFLFFLVKGLVWLVVFALISRGVIERKKFEAFKTKVRRIFGFR
jgi:hypothetical protein